VQYLEVFANLMVIDGCTVIQRLRLCLGHYCLQDLPVKLFLRQPDELGHLQDICSGSLASTVITGFLGSVEFDDAGEVGRVSLVAAVVDDVSSKEVTVTFCFLLISEYYWQCLLEIMKDEIVQLSRRTFQLKIESLNSSIRQVEQKCFGLRRHPQKRGKKRVDKYLCRLDSPLSPNSQGSTKYENTLKFLLNFGIDSLA
jgi:hypothetical protein